MTLQYRFAEHDGYDREAVVWLTHTVDPDSYLSVADLADRDENQRRAARPVGRWMATSDDRMVGYASFAQSPWLRVGVLYTNVMVHPDHRQRGLGRSLLEHVESSAAGIAAIRLLAQVKEPDERSNRFAQQAGFSETDRWWRSTLDLTRFEPESWQETVDRTASQGIRLVPVAELRETHPDWETELYRLYVEIEHDVPAGEPIVDVPFDDFVEKSLGRDMLAGGFLIAMDGNAMVGLTEPQSVDADPSAISQDLTGVRASHRRRGIALALKAAAAAWAKEQGYTSIRTYNAQSNAAMLAVNGRLGFTRDVGTIEYTKDL